MQRIFDASNRSLSPLAYLATAALVLAAAFVIDTIPWGGAEPAHAVAALHAAAAPAAAAAPGAAERSTAEDAIPPAELVPSAAYN